MKVKVKMIKTAAGPKGSYTAPNMYEIDKDLAQAWSNGKICKIISSKKIEDDKPETPKVEADKPETSKIEADKPEAPANKPPVKHRPTRKTRGTK